MGRSTSWAVDGMTVFDSFLLGTNISVSQISISNWRVTEVPLDFGRTWYLYP